MNVRAERFPLFDGLRAIAALSVLVYHAAFFAAARSPNPTVTQYTGHLDVGVAIFFLISGFLLYRPFVRAHLRDQRAPATLAYGWRRFLRIVPAYWVALTVVALWLPLPYVFHGSNIPIYYGFGQIYIFGDAIGGIGQAWTLCVEVTFYAFLPVWAWAMRRVARDRRSTLWVELTGLAVLFVVSTLYKVWALYHVAPSNLASPRFLMPLPNFFDQFAVGMAIAVASVWYEDRPLPRPLRWVRRWPAACWGVALLALWIVSTRIGFHGDVFQAQTRKMFLGRHELYTVIATALLLPVVFAVPGESIVARLLGSRVLRYLGLVSYGIYLYHLAFVTKIQQWLGTRVHGGFTLHFALYLVLAFVGATAAASISYYVVERPALRLKNLLGMQPAAARGEAIAEPAPAAPVSIPREL
jgi:peptidoglycan/LPS O-acetylase OafA/YrhL